MIKEITSYNLRQNKVAVNVRKNKDTVMPKHGAPSFTGVLDVAMVPLQVFEANPMLNVSLLDVTTAIAPRTYEESKTNGFAGFEAFRRESSGLIVNCLIPSFIVLGVASAAKNPIMG